ncbi:hypothetical protein [Myroides fluvii]|uniref:hypothetical protein n=1 Tax=Myroides fluvii TaxID=2572594 RepID=UPI00131B6295|nr:hypothetical protein [Myroides fluvii]
MNIGDLIDKFVQNKVTAEEKALLKRQVEEDQKIKEEVVFQLSLAQAIKKDQRNKLKERLKQLDQQKSIHNKKGVWFRIAAVLVVGLGIAYWINTPENYDKTYKTYFEVYPNVVAPTVRYTETTVRKIDQAFNAYDSRDYHVATELFYSLCQEDNTEVSCFYYAMSLLADNQIEKAIEVLETTSWQNKGNYEGQINWYLALAHLKLQNIARAQYYLTKTIELQSSKAKEAQVLLKQIKK